MALFAITPRFKGAIKPAAGISGDRLRQFLERVIVNLVQRERPFSDEEEKKLQQVFGLGEDEVQCLVEVCMYTFEKAAAESASGSDLAGLLQSAGVGGEQLAAFQDVWEALGTDLIRAVKDRPFGAPGGSHILDLHWRVHLKVADSDEGHLLEPSGVLQLKLGATPEEGDAKSIALVFSFDELVEFYEKLETIQDQLDSLS